MIKHVDVNCPLGCRQEDQEFHFFHHNEQGRGTGVSFVSLRSTMTFTPRTVGSTSSTSSLRTVLRQAKHHISQPAPSQVQDTDECIQTPLSQRKHKRRYTRRGSKTAAMLIRGCIPPKTLYNVQMVMATHKPPPVENDSKGDTAPESNYRCPTATTSNSTMPITTQLIEDLGALRLADCPVPMRQGKLNQSHQQCSESLKVVDSTDD